MGQGAVLGYVKHQGHAAHIGYHVGTTIAKERQRYAGYGHQARGHANVFKHMEQQHAHHPRNHQGAKLVPGITCQVDHPQNNQQIEG